MRSVIIGGVDAKAGSARTWNRRDREGHPKSGRQRTPKRSA